MGFLLLAAQDHLLDLLGQLVGIAHRPARAVAQRLGAELLVAVEDFVAGLRDIPKDRQTSLMPSPSSNRATNRRRSSITELSFHGINTSRKPAKSVTYVSGTIRYLSLRSDTLYTDYCPDWRSVAAAWL